MILHLLPLLRGWGWRVKDIDSPIVVQAGQDYVIDEISEVNGWIWIASGEVDYPYCQLLVTYHDARGRKNTVDMRPYGPYHAGMMFPSAFGLTAGVYDQDEERYVVNLMPVNPIPYKGYLRVSLKAPPTSNVTLLAYHHAVIEIVDEEEFKKSLREVLGVTVR